MSRTATPPTAHPVSPTTPLKIPHEKIAQRAYEKWCKRGCPHGSDMKDWIEAETELRLELSRTAGATGTTRR
jgi:hypothetical protein